MTTTTTLPSWMDERLISPVSLLQLTQTYDSLHSRVQQQQQPTPAFDAESTATTTTTTTTASHAWRYTYYALLRNLQLTCTLLVQIYNNLASSLSSSSSNTAAENDVWIQHDDNNRVIKILQQTSRRCELLLEVLRLTASTVSYGTTYPSLWNDKDENEEDTAILYDMENIHVEEAPLHYQSDRHRRHHLSLLFSWNFSSTIDLSGAGGVDHDDNYYLEAEEQRLIQMANTPIPTEKDQEEQQHHLESSSTCSAAAAAAASTQAQHRLLELELEKERLYTNMRREWGVDTTI
jgi:hypothetical protein